MMRAILTASCVLAAALAATTEAPGQAVQPGLGFIENVGQWQVDAAFVGRCPGLDVFVCHDEIVLRARSKDGSRGHVVRLGLDGVTGGPVGIEALPWRQHFLLGKDRAGWHRDVRAFGSMRYALREGGALEVGLEGPGPTLSLLGGDLGFIDLSIIGADGVRVEQDGSVSLLTSVGPISLPPPQFVTGDGGIGPLVFAREGASGLRIVKGTREPYAMPAHQAATSTGGLAFSTYIGGTSTERLADVAIGPDGAATVVGSTESADLPVTSGAYSESLDPNRDAFIAQFSPSGVLRFSTYLGGLDQTSDFGQEIEVDAHGSIVVAGRTTSVSFPVTAGALQLAKVGLGDWFITRLTPDGSDIEWSTFLGGGFLIPVEIPYGMELTTGGDIILCGQGSLTFPTTIGAFQESLTGDPLNSFAVVVRLDATGSKLVWSTFLNGMCTQSFARDLVIAPDESVYVVGQFSGDGFPFTPGAIQGIASILHPQNPFLVRLSPDGSELVFAGSLGGSSVETLFGVAVDTAGRAVVVGETGSTDLPVTEDAVFPDDTVGLGPPDAFVAVVEPTGSEITYLTYLPGPDLDTAHDVAVDGSGAIVVSGSTSSNGFFTTPGAVQEDSLTIQEDVDLFVTRFAPDRRSVEYSTRLGGVDDEGVSVFTAPCALALDPQGDVVIAGETYSDDYPTTPGAFQSENMGIRDAVISRLTLLPTGVSRHGTSTPGCRGPLVISATSMPQVGSRGFAVTCTKAPAFSGAGLLAVSLAALDVPLAVQGAHAWVDPNQLVRLLPMRSNAIGYSEHAVPIAALLDHPLALQVFWPDDCALGGWSASAALLVEVQP